MFTFWKDDGRDGAFTCWCSYDRYGRINVTKFEIRKLWCWWDELIYLQLQWVKGENWSPYCHCIHVSLLSKQNGDQIYLNKTVNFPGLQIDWTKRPMFTRRQQSRLGVSQRHHLQQHWRQQKALQKQQKLRNHLNLQKQQSRQHNHPVQRRFPKQVEPHHLPTASMDPE